MNARQVKRKARQLVADIIRGSLDQMATEPPDEYSYEEWKEIEHEAKVIAARIDVLD